MKPESKTVTTRVWGVLPLHAGVKGPVWCQSFQSPCRASTEERKSRMLESERRLLRQVFPPSTWNVIPKRVFGCFWVGGWVDWEISVIRLSQHWIHSVTCAGFCVQRGQSTQSGPVEEKSGQSQRGEQHHEGGGSPTTSPRGARGGAVCVVRIRGVIRQGHLKHICI